LIRLAHLTLDRDLEKRTQDLFQTFAQQGLGSSQLLIALDFAFGPSKEIVIAGEHNDQLTQEMIKTLYEQFLPNKVVIFRPALDSDAKEIIALTPFVKSQIAQQGKTTAYVCENYICKLPTSDLKQFKLLLEKK